MARRTRLLIPHILSVVLNSCPRMAARPWNTKKLMCTVREATVLAVVDSGAVVAAVSPNTSISATRTNRTTGWDQALLTILTALFLPLLLRLTRHPINDHSRSSSTETRPVLLAPAEERLVGRKRLRNPRSPMVAVPSTVVTECTFTLHMVQMWHRPSTQRNHTHSRPLTRTWTTSSCTA